MPLRPSRDLHEVEIAENAAQALRAYDPRWEHYSAIRLSWQGARAWLMDQVGGPGAGGAGSES